MKAYHICLIWMIMCVVFITINFTVFTNCFVKQPSFFFSQKNNRLLLVFRMSIIHNFAFRAEPFEPARSKSEILLFTLHWILSDTRSWRHKNKLCQNVKINKQRKCKGIIRVSLFVLLFSIKQFIERLECWQTRFHDVTV